MELSSMETASPKFQKVAINLDFHLVRQKSLCCGYGLSP